MNGNGTRFPNGLEVPYNKLSIEKNGTIEKIDLTQVVDDIDTAESDISDIETAIANINDFVVNVTNIEGIMVAGATPLAVLFTAPFACKFKYAYESHGVVCDAADTVKLTKLASGGTSPTGLVDIMTGTWALNSAIHTPVKKSAVATSAANLAEGDQIILAFASGDGTNYDNGCITMLFERI
jgi:hypothetical protein